MVAILRQIGGVRYCIMRNRINFRRRQQGSRDMTLKRFWRGIVRGIAILWLCVPSGVMAQDAKDIVVFDIDGTLTPSVWAISSLRVGAVKAANTFADAGVEVVYVTARIRFFQSSVQGWLDEKGFPPGTVYFTQTDMDRDDHGAFKARVLQTYINEGRTVVAAFGDSSSDFVAYAAVGIPEKHVFALRRRGAWSCQTGIWQGCYDSWAELVPEIEEILRAN